MVEIASLRLGERLGEAVADVRHAQQVDERFDLLARAVGLAALHRAVQHVRGGSGGGGEVEIGVVAQRAEDGVHRAAEAAAFEPAAEDDGGGPVVGRGAVGVFGEGAEENSLGAGGIPQIWHKCLLFLSLRVIVLPFVS